MENSETAVPPADNTAQETEQTLLEPQGTPAAAGSGTPQEPAAKPAESPKEGAEDAPLMDPEGTEAHGKADEEQGAPETYEAFAMPEGFKLEGDELTKATELFRGLNLSQKQAQKLVDEYTERVTAAREAELNELAARRKSWRAEVRNRPNYAAERALALKGMAAVVTEPDEKALFKDSWMSDHPALWKVFVKIGRLTGEDHPPKGTGEGREENINLRRFPVA